MKTRIRKNIRTLRKRNKSSTNRKTKTKIIGGEETYEEIYEKMKNKIEQISYKTPENIAKTFYEFVKKNPQYTHRTYMGVREYILGKSLSTKPGLIDTHSINISGPSHESVRLIF